MELGKRGERLMGLLIILSILSALICFILAYAMEDPPEALFYIFCVCAAIPFVCLFIPTKSYRLMKEKQKQRDEAEKHFEETAGNLNQVTILIDKLYDPANKEWAKKVRAEADAVLNTLPKPHYTLTSKRGYYEDQRIDVLCAKRGFLSSLRAPYKVDEVLHHKYDREQALTKWIVEELHRHGVEVAVVEKRKGYGIWDFKPAECVTEEEEKEGRVLKF